MESNTNTPTTTKNPPKRRRTLNQSRSPGLSVSNNSQSSMHTFLRPSSSLQTSDTSSSRVEVTPIVSTPEFNQNFDVQTEQFLAVSDAVAVEDTQLLRSNGDGETQPSNDDDTSRFSIHNIHKEINEELQKELKRSSQKVGAVFDEFRNRLKDANEILQIKNDAIIGIVNGIQQEYDGIKQRLDSSDQLAGANKRQYELRITNLNTEVDELKQNNTQLKNELDELKQNNTQLKNELDRLKARMDEHFPINRSS